MFEVYIQNLILGFKVLFTYDLEPTHGPHVKIVNTHVPPNGKLQTLNLVGVFAGCGEIGCSVAVGYIYILRRPQYMGIGTQKRMLVHRGCRNGHIIAIVRIHLGPMVRATYNLYGFMCMTTTLKPFKHEKIHLIFSHFVSSNCLHLRLSF